MAWLTGWNYRKSHVINGVAGAEADWQVGIVVYYGSGTDGTETAYGTKGKVYCNSHCRTDFGDIRFTDDDGETELDYYLEEKVDSDYAIFWVEVADNLASNQTIYVYYGKADATTTSNPVNTMITYEGFEDGTFGIFIYSLIPSGCSQAIVTSPVKRGTYAAEIVDGTSGAGNLRYTPSGTFRTRDDVVFENWIRVLDGCSGSKFGAVYLYGTNKLVFYFGVKGSDRHFYYWNGGDYDTGVTATADTWYKAVVFIDYTSGKFSLYIYSDPTTVVVSVVNGNIASLSTTDRDVNMVTNTTFVGTMYYDDFFSRKCVTVDSEPTHGSWGSEESSQLLKTVMDSLGLSDAVLRNKPSIMIVDDVSASDSLLRNKTLLPITDIVGLTDSPKCNKTLTIMDSVGSVDGILGNKSPLIVSDAANLSDALLRHKSFALTDAVALADAILRDKPSLSIADAVSLAEKILSDKSLIIADSLGSADSLLCNKAFAVSDLVALTDAALIDKELLISGVVNLLDQVFRHKPSITIADAIGVAEAVLVARLLTVEDSVNLADVLRVLKTLKISDTLALVDAASTPSRVLQALDSVGLADSALVNKVLQVTESISLVEVVEIETGGVKKTRLFLILGDLAVQLTGD